MLSIQQKLHSNKNKTQLVVDIISILYIILFVYAASSKILEYDKFKVQIGQSPMLTAITGFVVWFIPLLEILIALLLTTSRYKLIGMYLSMNLMMIFTVYIYIILNFSDYIPCSCGGILEKMTWKAHLIFNILFVILGIIGIVSLVKLKEVSNRLPPSNH